MSRLSETDPVSEMRDFNFFNISDANVTVNKNVLSVLLNK